MKLEQYLQRKLREREWEEDAEPDIAGIVERFVDLGFIDDAHYAQVKADSLLRRGYGNRRISETLRHAGIDEHITESVKGDYAAAKEAALVFVRRKRFGPFGAQLPDMAARKRQIQSIARAGHGFQIAIALVDAKSEEEAERLVYEEE